MSDAPNVDVIHYLEYVIEGGWHILKWLFEVAIEIIALYTIVAVVYLEHELIHKLVPGVRRTWLGRLIILLGNLFKRVLVIFGFTFYRPSLMEQWAGLYESEEYNEYIKTEIDIQAANISSRLVSRTFRNRRIFLAGEEGSGTRHIAQEVFRIFSREKREVFYFDCSAITNAELHRRFITNIAAWANAAEIVSASEADMSSMQEVENIVSVNNVRAFLSRYKERTENKPIIIIIDAERLLKPREDADYHKTHDILHMLTTSKYSTALLTVDSDFDFEKALKLRYRFRNTWRVIRRKLSNKRIEYRGVEYQKYAHLYEKVPSQPSKLRSEPLKVDEFHVLLTLLEHSSDEGRLSLLKQFASWKPETFSEVLIDQAIYHIANDSKFSNSDEATLTGRRLGIYKLLTVLALFDAPVPVASVTKLWTACKLPFNTPYTTPDQVILSDEPDILQQLVNYGLVQRLRPSSQLFLHPIYSVRPAFRRDCLAFLQGEREEDLFEVASKVAGELLSDLRPPGITPISKYLSQGDFRASRELIGYLRQAAGGDELIVPLPPEICEIISIVQGDNISPELTTYTWWDRSGNEHIDLLAVVSPTELSKADRVCRVGVHIVSREGTGRAVQEALKRYVDTFLDVEGDSYRIGPGGYLELLVRLKPLDEIIQSERIRILPFAKDRGNSQKVSTRELTRHIENEVQKVLRANIDDQATVQMILGTDQSVISDWEKRMNGFGKRIDLEQSTESVYGSASRYSLVARPDIYNSILAHLTAQTGKSETPTVMVECVFSYTTLQVFFIFKALDLRRRVRARVVNVEDTNPKHVTLGFMEVAEQKYLDLDSLKHGPNGAYIAEFELPRTPFGVNQNIYNAALLKNIMDQLRQGKVNISFINSPSLIEERQAGEKVIPAAKQKRFANGPVMAAEDFAYVTEPESFHRYMRKHLFIPDSDAAILAVAQSFLATRRKGQYRALEIGSGTGALTAKLIQAGIKNIDTIEPDKILSGYWEQLKKTQRIEQEGEHYNCSLEDFFHIVSQKYDLVVSQGVHHHIPTAFTSVSGEVDENYRLSFLKLCRRLLIPDGIYILSDEFLVDYQGNKDRRLKNLDRWYRCVIATALADGYSVLADLEYRFWLNDRDETVEYKESIEEFESRLREAKDDAPFDVKSVIRFGMTEDFGGGFGVLVLKPR